MSIRPTITLGICLAAGLAFGIGLARPGDPATVDTSGSTIQAGAQANGGYGSGSAQAIGGAAPTAAGEAAVTIADFNFEPAALAVAPGATITVGNDDGASHTLTAKDGSFDSGTIANGAVATITAPAAAGAYEIFCSIHPSMQGTLTVQG